MTNSVNRTTMHEKISYFFVNLGNIPIMTLVASFLSLFYVTVLGIDEIKVGTMFLIARTLDALNDPAIGFAIDRVKEGKLGKFRKTLLVGTIICSLNYLLLWVGPAYTTGAVQLAVAYISYLLLGVTFPIIDISLNSMLPVMTDNIDERNVLGSIKTVGYGIGSGLCGIVAPIMISAMNSTKEAYLIVILIFVALVVVLSIGGTLGIKQHIKFDKETTKYSIKDLGKFFFEKPVLITFIVALFYNTANNFITGTNGFYAQYVLGDIGMVTWFTVAMGVAMAPFIFITPKLANKYGKKHVYGIGIIISGVGMLLRLVKIDSSSIGIAVAIISMAISGIGSALFMILFYGVQADNIDYIEYKSGKRSEGAISALSSMITKLGVAVGGAFPLYILSWTKTAEGSYSAMGFGLSSAVIPAILCTIGGLIFIFYYTIDKNKLKEIGVELQKRRNDT